MPLDPKMPLDPSVSRGANGGSRTSDRSDLQEEAGPVFLEERAVEAPTYPGEPPPVSGHYSTRRLTPPLQTRPIPVPSVLPTPSITDPHPWPSTEELAVDVDGRYPQRTVSGTIVSGLALRVDWIASVVPTGSPADPSVPVEAPAGVPDQWSGTIWFKDGDTSLLPQDTIHLTATRSWFTNLRKVTVEFSGGGATTFTRDYNFTSKYFHSVEFEYDGAEGVTPTTSMHTYAHPNRPATLWSQTLSLETVYRSAGFDVTISPDDSIVPLTGAGADAVWSDQEMHDAMQAYWSRFADAPRWAMWVFFAAQHELGSNLGGIMFDDIGPNHRQGTAIFYDSFISDAPAGDPAPAAWVDRMRFWTAAHEMGHGFNLAHSWQKSWSQPGGRDPWIPLADEPEARSFLNYPYYVTGGETAFFADFEFRFSDQELLFMRHAPARMVQMGNADWFDDHGFEQADMPARPALKLELRVNRAKPEFEFLEPVMVELKLANVSDEPVLIDEDMLGETDDMTVIIKRQGRNARQWLPFARYCAKAKKEVLNAGESRYAPLFVAAGRNGWDLSEPGRYLVQVALRHDDQHIVSNRLTIRVTPPRGYDEEYIAQDFFSDEVGRVLAFDGTTELKAANDVLRETASRLPQRRVALHAQVALAAPLMDDAKQLVLPANDAPPMALTSAAAAGGKIKVVKAKPQEAKKQLVAALTKKDQAAAETLGHIQYHRYVHELATCLAADGDSTGAAKLQTELLGTLKARKVADWVLKEIERARASYKA